nr:hypothetical protein [Tanacetum cinerariifolium]
MTTRTVTSTIDSQMHNNIMAAGSRDRPPMLATGRYPQWRSRSHTTTRYKGKEIAKPITPPSESASKEDIDPEQAQRDKDMQKNFAFIEKYFKRIYKPTNNNLKTSSNSRNKDVDTTSRYKNDNHSGQFGNQRTMNVVGARENIGSLGFSVLTARNLVILLRNAESQKGLKTPPNMDEEIDEQELEAHYNYMAKIQEDQWGCFLLPRRVSTKLLGSCEGVWVIGSDWMWRGAGFSGKGDDE